MLDFDAFRIALPQDPIGLSLVITPEEAEFALATNGQSLQSKVMFALIAHLIVEPDSEERGMVRSGAAAAAE
jgi:hypothetical protein